MKTLFKNAEEVTSTSHHPCHAPNPIDDRTLDAPLFPPISQWGQPAVSHRADESALRLPAGRQADTGVAHHRVLDDAPAASAGAGQAAAEPAPVVARPVYDWEAANQRKIDAVARLAPLSNALDDIETRIDELLARTKNLELG